MGGTPALLLAQGHPSFGRRNRFATADAPSQLLAKKNLDTTAPGGRPVFHVFAALAEFIRELIVAGTHEGLAAARALGGFGGCPSIATPRATIRAARDMLPNPEASITSIAKLLGVSRSTLYNHIPDLKQLRSSRALQSVEPRTP